uniref:Exocyst subunit Exo70 family protein n=1 Tax=Triticum urartu TaxID=4572 RepID=A0A8R7TC05_TRIUA
MEAAGDGSMGMFRATPDAAAGIGRSAEVAALLNKMVDGLGATVLHISGTEFTVHPSTHLLIQALQNYSRSTYLVEPVHHTTDPCSHMVDCWAAKLEEDAEMIRQGEKGVKYIFLMNNTCLVLQMMGHPGAASFAGAQELASRLTSMVELYKKCYLDECWAPLHRLNLDMFAAEFRATCDCQSTWKVGADSGTTCGRRLWISLFRRMRHPCLTEAHVQGRPFR